MKLVNNYLSLIKFSHTLFALPFALIGFFLATTRHSDLDSANSTAPHANYFLVKFLLVILCMVFARSAAMAFNRYLDKNIDARNPRTAVREIPAGIIPARHALLFTIICSILFIICCRLINTICFYLSFVALFVILFYSYTKRFTALCHLVLGLGLALAPIGAYLAVTGKFHLLPLLFSGIVFFWVSGFDIIYALQDEAFDKANKLYSIPAALGKSTALRVSRIFHLIASLVVIAVGAYGQFGLWYWLAAFIFISMLVYQQSLVRPNDLSKVNIAFMTANGFASVLFSVFVLLDLFTA